MISIPNRAAEFREAFASKKWVMDGAMATMLFSKGASTHRPAEELNLRLAAMVRDVHREYLAAGAEILRTNTFGANRIRLAQADLSAKLTDINRAAVRIARTVADGQAFVAGTVGPTGVRLAPLGSLTEEEARSAFHQQAAALAGVDLFVLETFRDIAELRAAVDGIRKAAGSEIVVIAHLSVEDDGRLQDGTPPERYGPALNELAADAVGINCSSGPYAVFNALGRVQAGVDKPLSASPGAGFPAAGSADYFARQPWDVHVAGGCCGTTPEHIRQLRSVFGDGAADPTPLVAAEDYASAWPRGLASANIEESRDIEVAKIEKILYLRTLGLSASDIQRDLLTTHALGQRNILCQTGEGWGALDIDSIGMIRIAAGLNQGRDFGGNPIEATAFRIGAVANPGAKNLDREITCFESKVRAGAQFAITQPVFDIALFEVFLERIEAFAIPIVATLWPITNARTADYAVNELHIPIPETILNRIAAGEGLEIAAELTNKLRPLAAGLRRIH